MIEKSTMDKIFNNLMVKYNYKEIELNKTYWVSEWSWTPIADGYFAYEQTIRSVENIDGVMVYRTEKNNRKYFAWDLYETEEEAKKMSEFKNSYGYTWAFYESHYILD